MKRSLKFVLLGFFLLAAVNYFFLAAQKFFQGFTLYAPYQSDQTDFSHGLPSLNISFFKKGAAGWSYVTQGYGRTPFSWQYPDGWHDGIDIAASYGAPVYAMSGGTILATGNQDDYCWRKAFGRYVAIKNNDGKFVSWYAHLGNINVKPGQAIASGTLIGTIGNTGLETGPHLHFSLFAANDFTMTPRNGCGPEPTGRDTSPIPYLQSLFK